MLNARRRLFLRNLADRENKKIPVEVMEPKCRMIEFETYTCFVESVSIRQPNATTKLIQCEHRKEHTNADVECILFGGTNIIEYLPRGLYKFFPGLTCLRLQDCGLKEISRVDLVGLENLEVFKFIGNLVTSLPNDLFQDMRKLKIVSFYQSKLERISSKLLQPLLANEVEYVGFRENAKIDSFYRAEDKRGSVATMEELMDIIDRNFEPPKPDVRHEETAIFGNKELWTSGRLSDFTIIAGEQSFKVHKNILTIHSSVFMTMLDNDNKESREGKMIIKDFSSEVVEEFLLFIYTGEIPDATNAMDLFAMAHKYDVDNLKAECEEMVVENINVSNAMDILNFGNLYELDIIINTAFYNIRKMFPKLDLPLKLMKQPECLKEVVHAQRDGRERKAEIYYIAGTKHTREFINFNV